MLAIFRIFATDCQTHVPLRWGSRSPYRRWWGWLPFTDCRDVDLICSQVSRRTWESSHVCNQLTIEHYVNACCDWCVGSGPDETFSEMWHTLWIVRFREPIATRTHIVMFGHTRHMHVSVPLPLNPAWTLVIASYVSVGCSRIAYENWHMQSPCMGM